MNQIDRDIQQRNFFINPCSDIEYNLKLFKALYFIKILIRKYIFLNFHFYNIVWIFYYDKIFTLYKLKK